MFIKDSGDCFKIRIFGFYEEFLNYCEFNSELSNIDKVVFLGKCLKINRVDKGINEVVCFVEEYENREIFVLNGIRKNFNGVRVEKGVKS